MSAISKIEWTDRTWNPVRGCSLVSDGCRNCYAMKVAHRFSNPGGPYEGLTEVGPAGPRWNGKIRTVDDALTEPLRWKKPQRIFVNSMSDLFHEGVPDEFVARVFAVMALSGWHTFQILTKRPKRMQRVLTDPVFRDEVEVWIEMMLDDEDRPPALRWDALQRRTDDANATAPDVQGEDWPLPNVWLGVSCENQQTADERIPLLLQTPAAIRFISAEPLLGPIDLREMACREDWHVDALDTPDASCRLHWVICGGESGPGARPMHPDWARSLRDRCVAAGAAFFFKQWGEWTPGVNVDRRTGIVETASWFNERWVYSRENLANDEGHIDDDPDLYRVGKKAAGRVLDGRTWDEFPQARETVIR